MIEEIRGNLGEELINKNIIHCVTSSVSLEALVLKKGIC
jgi:hypothetical protein